MQTAEAIGCRTQRLWLGTDRPTSFAMHRHACIRLLYRGGGQAGHAAGGAGPLAPRVWHPEAPLRPFGTVCKLVTSLFPALERGSCLPWKQASCGHSPDLQAERPTPFALPQFQGSQPTFHGLDRGIDVFKGCRQRRRPPPVCRYRLPPLFKKIPIILLQAMDIHGNPVPPEKPVGFTSIPLLATSTVEQVPTEAPPAGRTRRTSSWRRTTDDGDLLELEYAKQQLGLTPRQMPSQKKVKPASAGKGMFGWLRKKSG